MTLPTEDEVACLSVSADLWNRFLNLPQQHPDDIQEFRQHLHGLQNMILARPAQRHLKIKEAEKVEGEQVEFNLIPAVSKAVRVELKSPLKW